MTFDPATPARQRGVTIVGLLMVLAVLGVFVYAAARLVPVYVEYMNVAKVLENVKTEAADGATLQALRLSIERHFDVEDVHSIASKDVEITRDRSSAVIHVDYDAYAPFIANVSFVVHFDKTVTTAAASGP